MNGLEAQSRDSALQDHRSTPLDPIRLVLAAATILACAGWTFAAAPVAAGEASNPFPDPPGYHPPVTSPAPGNSGAKPAVHAPSRSWVQKPSPQLAARF